MVTKAQKNKLLQTLRNAAALSLNGEMALEFWVVPRLEGIPDRTVLVMKIADIKDSWNFHLTEADLDTVEIDRGTLIVGKQRNRITMFCFQKIDIKLETNEIPKTRSAKTHQRRRAR
jgi:hypothetical protein